MQLGELFALLSAVKDHEVSAAEAIERLEWSHQWVWVAMAPDCALQFVTDGFRESLTALLTYYRHWVQPPRRQATGPAPKPCWMPLSVLLYAQVVKSYRRKHIIGSHIA